MQGSSDGFLGCPSLSNARFSRQTFVDQYAEIVADSDFLNSQPGEEWEHWETMYLSFLWRQYVMPSLTFDRTTLDADKRQERMPEHVNAVLNHFRYQTGTTRSDPSIKSEIVRILGIESSPAPAITSKLPFPTVPAISSSLPFPAYSPHAARLLATQGGKSLDAPAASQASNKLSSSHIQQALSQDAKHAAGSSSAALVADNGPPSQRSDNDNEQPVAKSQDRSSSAALPGNNGAQAGSSNGNAPQADNDVFPSKPSGNAKQAGGSSGFFPCAQKLTWRPEDWGITFTIVAGEEERSVEDIVGDESGNWQTFSERQQETPENAIWHLRAKDNEGGRAVFVCRMPAGTCIEYQAEEGGERVAVIFRALNGYSITVVLR